MFPYGFADNKIEPWNVKDLSENEINIYDNLELKMDAHQHIGICISYESWIRSNFTFTDTFSFFILCRKDAKNGGGRFITGKWGNIFVGFWNNMKGNITSLRHTNCY